MLVGIGPIAQLRKIAGMTPTLTELGRQHGTDKVRHGYLTHVEPLLAPFRNEAFDLLEIGVKDGASIRMWADYFPRARIVGLDIHPAAVVQLPRCVFVQGNQGDGDLLSALGEQYRFRLVIDDGSHLWPHQILGFQRLFPRMEPEGVYICEDLHTSYPPLAERYHGGADESAAAWFLRLAEAIVSGHRATTQAGFDPIPSNLVRMAHTIRFIRSAVIVTR